MTYTTPPRLTKEQAAILGAYTGIVVGPFSDIQDYAEAKLGRPLWTHQFASEDLSAELKAAAKEDLFTICYDPDA